MTEKEFIGLAVPEGGGGCGCREGGALMLHRGVLEWGSGEEAVMGLS